jgi:hypothetical protein
MTHGACLGVGDSDNRDIVLSWCNSLLAVLVFPAPVAQVVSPNDALPAGANVRIPGIVSQFYGLVHPTNCRPPTSPFAEPQVDAKTFLSTWLSTRGRERKVVAPIPAGCNTNATICSGSGDIKNQSRNQMRRRQPLQLQPLRHQRPPRRHRHSLTTLSAFPPPPSAFEHATIRELFHGARSLHLRGPNCC